MSLKFIIYIQEITFLFYHCDDLKLCLLKSYRIDFIINFPAKRIHNFYESFVKIEQGEILETFREHEIP